MNNKNNKKGISAVVATVLIILITVAAVTIVWTAIIPMINTQLDDGTACFNGVSQIQLNSEYTCRNLANNIVSIQISRGAKVFDLADIQVMFSSGGNTNAYNLMNISPSSNLPNINEEKVYTIVASTIGGNISAIDEIQIAPIISVKNVQSACGVSDQIALRDC